ACNDSVRSRAISRTSSTKLRLSAHPASCASTASRSGPSSSPRAYAVSRVSFGSNVIGRVSFASPRLASRTHLAGPTAVQPAPQRLHPGVDQEPDVRHAVAADPADLLVGEPVLELQADHFFLVGGRLSSRPSTLRTISRRSATSGGAGSG